MGEVESRGFFSHRAQERARRCPFSPKKAARRGGMINNAKRRAKEPARARQHPRRRLHKKKYENTRPNPLLGHQGWPGEIAPSRQLDVEILGAFVGLSHLGEKNKKSWRALKKKKKILGGPLKKKKKKKKKKS